MHPMRRQDREVTDPEKINSIISSCHCCRLGFCDQGKAYLVPLNFGHAVENGTRVFYFHGAKEGRKIEQMLGNNTYVKIPSIPEGLRAMQILASEGYHITATAIYTPMQAYLAAKAGAEYAAPYVNRIDNLGNDGINTTKKIHDIFTRNEMKTRLLAAGFKNSQQVQELCEYGVRSVTVASDVIDNLIKNANVTLAVNDFVADFESLCGQGKTMLNCEE